MDAGKCVLFDSTPQDFTKLRIQVYTVHHISLIIVNSGSDFRQGRRQKNFQGRGQRKKARPKNRTI